jgi:dienelactone hydrolase
MKLVRSAVLYPLCLLACTVIACAAPTRDLDDPGSGPGGPLAPEAPLPTASLVGPTAVQPLEGWRVERADGPAIDVYVARDDVPKPLLVFVQGSKCLPLFMVSPGRLVTTALPPDDVKAEMSRVHFAFVERRGLESFGPPPATAEEMHERARCTETHGGVSKTERVDDVAAAIRALAPQPWVSSVSVVGHSEGADVAAGVGRAVGDELLEGVGLLAGAGITRFFDATVEARGRGDAAVKRVFDDLLWITGPSAEGDYAGASITRQLTYAVDSTPLDDLRGLPLPVFVAAGSRDDKSPPESADAFVTELLRERERRVKYVILPDLDHGFTASDGSEHAREVLASVVDWVAAPIKERAVIVQRPSRGDR